MTLTQVRDLFYAPDWHPGDHPPMPESVASGRKPNVYACGFCHRADGPGGPENAYLMGLPAAYIVQQLADFKSGARKSSVQNRVPTQLKAKLAADITDAEVQSAAAYFASVKPRTVIRVVETELVPKTHVTAWFLSVANADEKEPIGERIIEVPENLQDFISRDTRTRFIAYVPTGSIEKGRALAASSDQRVPCDACHGPDLKGRGTVPGIAGHSPTYTFRQLYDFKHGARGGPDSAQMKPSVEKLSIQDMIFIAAYAASLDP
jgi:cytochrome c553